MNPPKKTLLDLNRDLALDELRAVFKKNDWSAAAYMELDYDKMPNDTVEALEYMKGMLDEHWLIMKNTPRVVTERTADTTQWHSHRADEISCRCVADETIKVAFINFFTSDRQAA